MVHRKKGRKLNRTASHRRALMSNLSVALIKNKKIKTTEAKAKELRTFIEPIVTKAKNALKYHDATPEKSIHLRRVVRSVVKDKDALNILFGEIALAVSERQGGYTRVLKTGFRPGDGASEAIIEFVDFSQAKKKEIKTDDGSKQKSADTVETEVPSAEGKKNVKTPKKKTASKPAGEKKTKEKAEKKPKTEKTSEKKKTSSKATKKTIAPKPKSATPKSSGKKED